MPFDRRLEGWLRIPEDAETDLEQPIDWVEPIIVEKRTEDDTGEEKSEVVWRGTFEYDPASSQFESARGELAARCAEYEMEPDGFEPDRWERML